MIKDVVSITVLQSINKYSKLTIVVYHGIILKMIELHHLWIMT